MSRSALRVENAGSANHWVLDLTPDGAAPSVLAVSKTPPVVLLQSPDLGHFVAEVFRKIDSSRTSLVDDVHDDRIFHVWRTNPGAVDHEAALEGDDDELRAFAAALDERFSIIDMRTAAIGMGFSWGRYGPATEVRRDGYRLLFAYAPPERRPGLLRRLF